MTASATPLSPGASQVGELKAVSPLPWEVIPATEHHGAYIVNGYGGTDCDLYAMSNPLALSRRNGGDSDPVPFTDADANAELIAKAVNAHNALVETLREVQQWISAWDPNFTQDDEWPETAARIKATLALASAGEQ